MCAYVNNIATKIVQMHKLNDAGKLFRHRFLFKNASSRTPLTAGLKQPVFPGFTAFAGNGGERENLKTRVQVTGPCGAGFKIKVKIRESIHFGD